MKKAKDAIEQTIDEFEEFLDHFIPNNAHLQGKGIVPIALNVEGASGIGKTSFILQYAKKHNLQCIKLNLAQMEELGDLIGFPAKEHQITKGDDTKWVPESTLGSYIEKGYVHTGEKRMTHAKPEWISGRGEGGILILDDYTRADHRFMQACMELIDRQTYAGWSLPKNWHIILTTNPDDGNHFVTAMDVAQKTRYITVNLKYDIKVWAKWAEKVGIDSRCINFLLLNRDIMSGKNSNLNARSITLFFNSICSIADFNTAKGLSLIQKLGESAIGPEVTTQFTLFINNQLDKLVSPEEIFDLSVIDATVVKKIRETLYPSGNYRADIAAVMAERIVNYSTVYAEKNNIPKDYIQRLISLINGQGLFSNDLKYSIAKRIINNNKKKFEALMKDTQIQKAVTA